MREICNTHTYANCVSAVLFQPVPTTADGAAVKVGPKSECTVPVGVYVGSSAIWVPVNEGSMVCGGKSTVEARVPLP